MKESAIVVLEVGDSLQRERREMINVWSAGRLENELSDSFNLIAKAIGE